VEAAQNGPRVQFEKDTPKAKKPAKTRKPAQRRGK